LRGSVRFTMGQSVGSTRVDRDDGTISWGGPDRISTGGDDPDLPDQTKREGTKFQTVGRDLGWLKCVA